MSSAHMHSEECGSTSSSSGEGSSNFTGVFDSEVPLVAYTTSYQSMMLKIHSLRNDRTIHVLRFGSPVLKFMTTNYTSALDE